MKRGVFLFICLLIIYLISGNGAYCANYTSLHDDIGPTTTNYPSWVFQEYGFFNAGSNHSLEHFKIYVPPGTKSLSLNFSCDNISTIYAVSRMGVPPTGYSIPAYNSMPLDPVGLSTLRNQVVLTRAGEGSVTILNDGNLHLNENQGGWIYVDIKGEGVVKYFSYNLTVDKALYDQWYSKIDWAQIESEGGGIYNPGENVTPPVNNDGNDQANGGGAGDQYGGGDGIFGGDNDENNSGGGSTTPNPSTDDAFLCTLNGGLIVNGQCQYNTNTGGSDNNSDRYQSADSALTCMFLGGTWIDGACTARNTNSSPPDNQGNNSGTDSDANTGGNNSGNNDGIFGGDNSGGSGDNKSSPTPIQNGPILPISCGYSLHKNIKKADLSGRNIVIPQPSLTIPPGTPAVPMEFYAMVTVGDYRFMATKDAFHPEIVGFVDFRNGDRIRSYDEGYIVEGEWTCDVFAENLHDLNVPVDVLIDNQVHFLFGYAPKGDLDKGNFENLRYSEIWFSN